MPINHKVIGWQLVFHCTIRNYTSQSHTLSSHITYLWTHFGHWACNKETGNEIISQPGSYKGLCRSHCEYHAKLGHDSQRTCTHHFGFIVGTILTLFWLMNFLLIWGQSLIGSINEQVYILLPHRPLSLHPLTLNLFYLCFSPPPLPPPLPFSSSFTIHLYIHFSHRL